MFSMCYSLHVDRRLQNFRNFHLYFLFNYSINLEVHGRARREAARTRRRKQKCKVHLLSQNSSRSNDSWRMSPKSTKYSAIDQNDA